MLANHANGMCHREEQNLFRLSYLYVKLLIHSQDHILLRTYMSVSGTCITELTKRKSICIYATMQDKHVSNSVSDVPLWVTSLFYEFVEIVT